MIQNGRQSAQRALEVNLHFYSRKYAEAKEENTRRCTKQARIIPCEQPIHLRYPQRKIIKIRKICEKKINTREICERKP